MSDAYILEKFIKEYGSGILLELLSKHKVWNKIREEILNKLRKEKLGVLLCP